MSAPELDFAPLSGDDPLHAALEKIGELYTATNFMTWWDARAFSVEGASADWDPSDQQRVKTLAKFIESHVLPRYNSRERISFSRSIARVGRVDWTSVREGLLDALKHHPIAGGTRAGTPMSQFSPHAFMLLDILEDQIAATLGLESGRELQSSGLLKCTRLRPREGSVFEGTLYQHLFLIWAPTSRRVVWFDLGGSH